MDSGSSIVREGPRHHRPVLEGRGLAVHGWSLGWRFVGAWWREIAQPSLVVSVTGFVGDGEHLFNVVVGFRLVQARAVTTSDKGTYGLELVLLVSPVVGWVRRGGEETRGRLVEAPQVERGLETHV